MGEVGLSLVIDARAGENLYLALCLKFSLPLLVSCCTCLLLELVATTIREGTLSRPRISIVGTIHCAIFADPVRTADLNVSFVTPELLFTVLICLDYLFHFLVVDRLWPLSDLTPTGGLTSLLQVKGQQFVVPLL